MISKGRGEQFTIIYYYFGWSGVKHPLDFGRFLLCLLNCFFY